MSTIDIFPLETPALRPLEIYPIEHEGRQLILVQDPMGILPGAAALPPDPMVMIILQMSNGENTVDDMAKVAREQTGLIVTSDKLMNIVREMDQAGLFFSERYLELVAEREKGYQEKEFRDSAVFAQTEDRLMMIKQLGEELRRHPNQPKGAGTSSGLDAGENVRAILSPHIDYMRGGQTYSWAYNAVSKHTTAKTFIILGTLHRPSSNPFIATAKKYRTPLGVAEVDTAILDEIESQYEGDLHTEEFLHEAEHTIELQVVYLQHMLQNRPFKIVPILVGSFDPYLYVDPPMYPNQDPDVAGMIAALRDVMAKHGDDVVLVGGVDFAHCGPEFGDQQVNSPDVEAAIRASDEEMLSAIEEVDPKAFFDTFRADFNGRKVCSVAAIYTLLAALEGDHKGKTLSYHQANNNERTCMVSFASVAFTGKEAAKPKIILATS